MQIPMPNDNKFMPFVHRFVSNFVEIFKPLQKIIKKDIEFKWTPLKKEYFEKVKG